MNNYSIPVSLSNYSESRSHLPLSQRRTPSRGVMIPTPAPFQNPPAQHFQGGELHQGLDYLSHCQQKPTSTQVLTSPPVMLRRPAPGHFQKDYNMLMLLRKMQTSNDLLAPQARQMQLPPHKINDGCRGTLLGKRLANKTTSSEESSEPQYKRMKLAPLETTTQVLSIQVNMSPREKAQKVETTATYPSGSLCQKCCSEEVMDHFQLSLHMSPTIECQTTTQTSEGIPLKTENQRLPSRSTDPLHNPSKINVDSSTNTLSLPAHQLQHATERAEEAAGNLDQPLLKNGQLVDEERVLKEIVAICDLTSNDDERKQNEQKPSPTNDDATVSCEGEESTMVMSPVDPQETTRSTASKKIFLDKYKKQVIRAFRKHINDQYTATTDGRHYRWVNDRKRSSIQRFFTVDYKIPLEIYIKYESVFVKLILNTLKDLTALGVTPNPELDEAFDLIFKQKPNLKNTSLFFSNVGIQALWWNEYKGRLPSFIESAELANLLKITEDKHALEKQLDKIGLDSSKFIGQPPKQI